MATPKFIRGASLERTLESMQQNLMEFRATGGNPKDAKLHFNVIDDIYFDIPISQVTS